MPTPSISVRQLIESGLRFSWSESIALVQGLAALHWSDGPRTSLDQVSLGADGVVSTARGDHVPTSVSYLAMLLGKLLPDGRDDTDRRAPAAVYFTLARALGLADAPPFESVEQFSETLARFERRPRAELLREVFARCGAPETACAAKGAAREGASHHADRRAASVPPATLRRLLREADADLYAARSTQSDVARRRAPGADALRRLLREADRTIYEMHQHEEIARLEGALSDGDRPRAPVRPTMPRVAPVPHHPRSIRLRVGRRSLAALAVMVVAAGGAAERQPIGHALRSLAAGAERAALPPAPPVAATPIPEAPHGTVHPNVAGTRTGGGPSFPAGRDAALAARGATMAPRFVNAVDRTGTTEVAAAGAAMTPAPEFGIPTGRLIQSIDAAQGPVFSPSFAVEKSAIFETKAGAAPAQPAASPAAESVRVLSIAKDRGRNYHPRLSPDGSLIAFDSDRDGVRGIYLASRDGRAVRRVSGPEYAAFPAWSPDGEHLAFVKSEPDQLGVWNVWSLDVGSGTMARLTWFRSGQPWGVSWFPDGRRICFAHENEIVVFDTTAGTARSFASPRADRLVRLPVVSPDGSKVLFEIDSDGAWLLDLADGSMREVLADPQAGNFAWSPDGRQIIFQSRPGGEWSSWSLQ